METDLIARLRFRWRKWRARPIPLAFERRFWRLAYATRHPLWTWDAWRKWHARPAVGQPVLAHGHARIVIGYGVGDPDRLLLDDGSGCSWMSCCDPWTADA